MPALYLSLYLSIGLITGFLIGHYLTKYAIADELKIAHKITIGKYAFYISKITRIKK